MSKLKTILHTLVTFIIGLLNGYLVMLLVGIMASYAIYITIWLTNIYKEYNLYWLYPLSDILLNIIELTFALFFVLSITKFLYYKAIRDTKNTTIFISTIGILLLPFLFSVLPIIYSIFKYNWPLYHLIIALAFIIIPIFINSYILKRFF